MEVGLGAGLQGDIRHPIEDPLDADLEFQTRQIRPQTAMHPGTETEVTVLGAVEDAAIGIREDVGVAVGGD